MESKKTKIIGYVIFCVMCISFLPVMYVGRYNHPTGDDYYYGVEVKQILEDGGNIFAAIQEAAKGVAYQYEHWQGTYSAMFLMHFPPNVFGETAYGLVTTGLILLFAGSVFFLLKPIVYIWMKESKALWLMISSVYVLLCLQTVNYFISESLFWYNGSVYYTGYYALTMFFWGIVLRFLIKPKKTQFVLLILLAFFLGGGNYVSLLPCILLLLTLTVLLILRHSKKSVPIGIVTICMLAGLAISAVAPGNQVREAALWDTSAVKAVLKSLIQGIMYIKSWTGVWFVLAIILLTPVLWRSYNKINFSFSCPLLVIGYLYGIFCSMACPTFYAMNSTGPGRAVAIVYYGFMAYMLFASYYLLGYIHRWIKKRQKSAEQKEGIGKKAEFAVGGLFVFLFLVQIVTGRMEECTTVRAVRLLAGGEARAYHEEYLERLEILRDNSVQDVVFYPYENQPDMLYVGDFTSDAMNVNNQRIAEYWNKNSIIVDYGE